MGVDAVARSVGRLRVLPVLAREAEVQDLVAERLRADGFRFEREVVLGPRSRIDFLVSDGTGVEVKAGKPDARATAAQVTRYCGFAAVQGLVLVVQRNVFTCPREAAGKPVRVVGLNALWGPSA